MSESVLLLGARLMGGSYLDAIHRAGKLAVVVEEQKQIERWGGQWDSAVAIAEDTPEAWMAGALEAASTHHVVAVVAYADEQVIAAAVVADQLGIPGPGLLAATASRDKSIIRSINAFAGIPQPKALTAPFDGLLELGGLDTDVVVQKVLDGAGSEGVRLVSKAEAPLESSETVILEEYVRGDYFSSELFVRDGAIFFASHTSKTSGGPPEFVDLAHLVGVALPSALRLNAISMLEQIIATYRISNAIVHVEWISAPGQRLAVIEFAVRTPGDFLMYGIERAHAFDAFGAVVNIALGKRPDPPRHPFHKVAVSFFPTITGDPDRARQTLERAYSLHELFVGYWRTQPSSGMLTSSDDRNHHVLLAASTVEAALELMASVQHMLAPGQQRS
jgi:hypothetical protein